MSNGIEEYPGVAIVDEQPADSIYAGGLVKHLLLLVKQG
jgi:hypothetical protein